MSVTRRLKPKARAKVKRRVFASPAIREFAEALTENIDREYWQLAPRVLDGSIGKERYDFQTGYLEGLQRAAAILKSTYAEIDEDQQEDDRDEKEARERQA